MTSNRIAGKPAHEATVTELYIDAIERAYAKLYTGHDIRIAAVREEVEKELWVRDFFDHALTEMAGRDGVHVRSECAQWMLTDRDRRDGITLGGTARHNLLIVAS